MRSSPSPLSVDALVIGGGSAGLSAALMLGRARRSVLVVDAGAPRNRFAAALHGVLGHDGLPPRELLRRGRAEVEGYGVEVRSGRVTEAKAVDGAVLSTLDDGSHVRARAVLLATGISDDLPPVPGLAEHWGSRVLHCPYCHGWEVRHRRLGVLATGPQSIHQVELVRQWSEQVVFFAADAAAGLDEAARRRLAARDVRIDERRVASVRSTDDADAPLEVVTADGERTEVDAIFTVGRPRFDEALLVALGVGRSDDAFGAVGVDAMGATDQPRVWAAGNVVSPLATIPVAMASGAMAGSAINAALVAEDAQAAVVAAD